MVVEDNEPQIRGDILPNKVTLPPLPSRYLKATFVESENHDESTPSIHAQATMHLPFAITDVHQMRLKRAKNLVFHEDDAKRVLELTLDASAISNDFLPGDTIGVLPENRDEDVDSILNTLHLADRANTVVKIALHSNTKKPTKIPPHVPLSSTPRIILKQCLNIHSIPKKLFLRALVECTSDENEKNLLKTLCSKEGSTLYTKMTSEGNLTFMKLLKICSSCRPDFDLLLEHLPRLLPRPYSIANSPLESVQEIKIVFSILKENPGVTTNFLQELTTKFSEAPNDSFYVSCFLREHNRFRYTEDDIMRNVIMISVGCGVSPFLGFMEHKDKLCRNTKYSKLGDMWLFSGFRYHKCSLYSNKIKDYLKKGILTEYFESFSRELEWKYKYVQDHIIENAERFVNKVFKENAVVYVCADGANISKDIQESIRKAIAIALQCSDEEAKEMLLQLQKENRYKEDIWT